MVKPTTIFSMTLKQAAKYIEANVKLQIESNRTKQQSCTLFLSGPPGIGKSEMYEQVCRNNGWGLCVVYLSQVALSQMTGLPQVIKESSSSNDGFIPWSCPDIFRLNNLRVNPAEPNNPIIMLLDDAHLLDKAKQQYLFQLLTQKTINNHSLPNNVIINLAGNRSEDKAGFQQFLAPVTNRIWYVDVDTDVDSWINDYAFPYGVHKNIIDFIKLSERFLCGTPLESSPWPSPRSWTFFSNQLRVFEQMNNGNTHSIENLRLIARGFVGDSATNEFINYMEVFSKWDPAEILVKRSFMGKKQVLEKMTRMEFYSLCSCCMQYAVGKLKETEFKMTDANKHILVSFCTDILDAGLSSTGHQILIPFCLRGIWAEEEYHCQKLKNKTGKVVKDLITRNIIEMLSTENRSKLLKLLQG